MAATIGTNCLFKVELVILASDGGMTLPISVHTAALIHPLTGPSSEGALVAQ